ncbi:hypothetical protein MEA186_00911 [Mesorhizobium amorphae CCNWGS0123]|uniref:Uncharacterized protein n=1 Tax=Mesorhizobium amorphae CCNWGS0123 TaxID=1082933 RepID=G6Y2P1_9HYPH|nr:hypothetical protein MEA186_00911 [Mesorhizobium amorphae CCNWGS0123]
MLPISKSQLNVRGCPYLVAPAHRLEHRAGMFSALLPPAATIS